MNNTLRKISTSAAITLLLGTSLLGGGALAFAEENSETLEEYSGEIAEIEDEAGAILDNEDIESRLLINRFREAYFMGGTSPVIYARNCTYCPFHSVRWKHIRNGSTINSGSLSTQRSSGLLDKSGFVNINFGRDYMFLSGDRVELDLIGKFGIQLDSRTIWINNNVNVTAPRLNGVQNVVINQGDSFDPMSGVTAVGTNNSNITAQIRVTGTVDANIPGLYSLSYSVTDPVTNLTTSVNRTVTVLPR